MFENAQKGAKLSPVHLFGLSKITRSNRGSDLTREGEFFLQKIIPIIDVLGVIAGFSLLKVKEHRRIAVVNLNNKVQLIAVALIIFIMGINLGSMEDFAHKMLTMGLQSLVFAIIPTLFSVIIVYIFSKLFIVKN